MAKRKRTQSAPAQRRKAQAQRPRRPAKVAAKRPAKAPLERPAKRHARELNAGAFDVLVLGASAGGEVASLAVLRALPRDFSIPIVLMQHLAAGSTLVERYARTLPFVVEWASAQSQIAPGKLLLAPPRSFLELLPDGSCVVQPCPGGAMEKPIDRLLESVARSFGPRAIGVILSGMLADGAAGAQQLHHAGGSVLVQTEASAEYPSMPRAAIQAGAADLIVALDDLGQVVSDLVAGTERPRPRSELDAIRRVFGDHGEVAARAREIDWSKTSVGPVLDWPEHLRVVASTVLRSAHPMALWWGPELVQLYNDPWRSFLGAVRHPLSLGARAPEAWPQVWQHFGPMVQQVLSHGHAVAREDYLLLIDRHGYLEEVYVTFSHSPICDPRGQVVGVLHTSWDTTKNVVAERRVRALRALAAQVVGAGTPREICERAAPALVAAAPDIPFALFYLLGDGRRQATLAAAAGVAAGSAAAPHFISIEAEGKPWPLGRVLAAGSSDPFAVVDDLASRLPGLSPPAAAPPGTLPARAAALLPLRGASDAAPIGVLVLGLSPHRPFDDSYRSFFDLVLQQLNAAIAEARARQIERERAERLADLDRTKTEFFANVSHEFRTPLTLILGPLEELLRDEAHLSRPVANELEVAARNARRLLTLVNSLLDFSLLDARRQRAQLELADLGALTTEVTSAFRSAIETAGLRFRVRCDPQLAPVPVDREMWEKIVSNLLSNALKFTLEGAISIELRALTLHAELVVADTGIGITEDEMPNLFKRFHRVPGARGRTTEGSGIGLSIVQDLVSRMGGQIRALSAKGKGTSFTIWMPYKSTRMGARDGDLRPAASMAPGAARQLASEASRWVVDADESQGALEDLLGPAKSSAEDNSARRQCIVVVDDNADMRDYLRRILSPHWRVELASDGERALVLLRESRADLLLADVMMPKLDGFALLTKIREDVALKTTPVVLVTARAGEQVAIQGLLAGADDYVAKPFSARELVARIGGQLALARIRRRTEEMNAFLVRFSDAVRGVTDARIVADTACRMLVERLGADRAHWSEIDLETKEYVVESRFVAPCVADTAAGRHPIDAWEPSTSILHAGRTMAIDDAQTDPRSSATVKDSMAKLEIGARIAVPVLEEGKLRAVQAVHQRSPRRWTPEEIALVEGVAGRCWAEVERARAERALRESEERLAAVFTALPVGVGVLDPAGTTILSNPEWQRFLPNRKVPSRDAEHGWRWRLWQDDGRLVAPEEFPVARALRGTSVVPGLDALYTQDDGTEIWARVSAVPFRDAGGRISGAFAVISNVDALKRTAEALRESQVQQAFLLKLSDALRPLADPVDIQATASRLVGEQLGVSRAFYADADGDEWRILTAFERSIRPLALGHYPIAAYGPWSIEDFRAGRRLVVPDARTDERFDASERSALAALDIVAAAAVPLVKGGNLVAMLAVHMPAARAWTDKELELIDATAERTWAAVERARAERALRASEAQLALDLADTQELQRVSSSLIKGDDVDALYLQILDAARLLMRSDMASIQRLVRERNELYLLAQQGFAPESAKFWEWVKSDDTTSCGIAFANCEPVIVPDSEAWDLIAGTEDLVHYRLSRIRAMLSMPLVSRDGRLVGVMSTHWHEVHQPSERELRLLDVLARQAADLIERRMAEEVLRRA